MIGFTMIASLIMAIVINLALSWYTLNVSLINNIVLFEELHMFWFVYDQKEGKKDFLIGTAWYVPLHRVGFLRLSFPYMYTTYTGLNTAVTLGLMTLKGGKHNK